MIVTPSLTRVHDFTVHGYWIKSGMTEEIWTSLDGPTATTVVQPIDKPNPRNKQGARRLLEQTKNGI